MKRKNKIIQNRHIYIDDFFSDKEKILRKINTNVFTYLFFVCSGLILLIVASILFLGRVLHILALILILWILIQCMLIQH